MGLHQDSVAQAVDDIASQGGSAIAIAGDVTDENNMRMAVERTVAAFGRLDIMVNNAATIAIGSLLDTTTATWDRLIAVNLRGAFLGCREAARQMIAQPSGGTTLNASPGRGRARER